MLLPDSDIGRRAWGPNNKFSIQRRIVGYRMFYVFRDPKRIIGAEYRVSIAGASASPTLGYLYRTPKHQPGASIRL